MVVSRAQGEGGNANADLADRAFAQPARSANGRERRHPCTSSSGRIEKSTIRDRRREVCASGVGIRQSGGARQGGTAGGVGMERPGRRPPDICSVLYAGCSRRVRGFGVVPQAPSAGNVPQRLVPPTAQRKLHPIRLQAALRRRNEWPAPRSLAPSVSGEGFGDADPTGIAQDQVAAPFREGSVGMRPPCGQKRPHGRSWFPSSRDSG